MTTTPTREIDLKPRAAGDSWEVDVEILGDMTALGLVLFMTIKRYESLPDPGYAQRRSDVSGVTILPGATTTSGIARFFFTPEETIPMREAAGGTVWYDVKVCSSGPRVTTTQRGQIPVLLDITQEQP